MNKAQPEVEFFEIYSPMIFGIALQLSPNQQKAEDLLLKTFELIRANKLAEQSSSSRSIELIKLVLQVAQELQYIGPQTIHTAPLISQLIAKKITVRETCEQNKSNVIQLGKEIRAELNSLRIQAINIHSNPLQIQQDVD